MTSLRGITLGCCYCSSTNKQNKIITLSCNMTHISFLIPLLSSSMSILLSLELKLKKPNKESLILSSHPVCDDLLWTLIPASLSPSIDPVFVTSSIKLRWMTSLSMFAMHVSAFAMRRFMSHQINVIDSCHSKLVRTDEWHCNTNIVETQHSRHHEQELMTREGQRETTKETQRGVLGGEKVWLFCFCFSVWVRHKLAKSTNKQKIGKRNFLKYFWILWRYTSILFL